MIIITRTDPHDPQATALLHDSHALMQSLFPPEDNFYLSIDDLCASNIAFFTAREGDTMLGTAALAVKDTYAEIKSMFVAENAITPMRRHPCLWKNRCGINAVGLTLGLGLFHPRKQFLFGGALTERFLLGSMGVMFGMFGVVGALFGRACGFVIHDRSSEISTSLTPKETRCTC